MSDEGTPYLYLALTILLWSATPAVAKLALAEINNVQMLFYNNIVGIIVLSAIIIFQKKQRLFSNYSKGDYLKMLGMGFLGLYLYYIFLYGSFSIAPAGQANMINYLWPVFVVLFSILILKEKFTWKTFLAIFLGFLGAILVVTRGNLSNLQNEYTFGYFLAFCAAACYGLFSVLGKKLNYDKFTSMLVFYVASLLLITPTMLVFSKFIIPQSPTTWLVILFLGGLSNSLGFVFWFKALEKGKTHRMANLIYITPFVSLIYVYFLNGEVIPVISIAGLALIIGGVLLQLKTGEK
ncbi:MAG: DMT family transporter [Candidatus Micrarchaeia archaeon]|jgi:drug/metabolite transporter (DMT)-like permease